MPTDLDRQSPAVCFRIPGNWQSKEELVHILKQNKNCRVDGPALWLESGPPLEWEVVPADAEFPGIFRSACRRQPLQRPDRMRLAKYTHNALLLGYGGSIPRAQHLLAAAATFVDAGGIGVFIDNSALAHSGEVWLELNQHRCEPLALMYAYINFISDRHKNVESKGMHVFGQRDGIVNSPENLPSLEDFLRMVCSLHPTLQEGHVFADTNGQRFRLQAAQVEKLFADHPMNNPYGFWRLELVRSDEPGPL